MMIRLNVPGTNVRYGRFVEDLSFDDFVKVVVEGEVVKGKAHRNKEEHFYLARRKDVEFIGEKK